MTTSLASMMPVRLSMASWRSTLATRCALPPAARSSARACSMSAASRANEDRKSVVEGKRVDLGGRRIIKKKKKKKRKEGQQREAIWQRMIKRKPTHIE